MLFSCTKARYPNGDWTWPGNYTQGSGAINNLRFVAGQLQLMQVGGPREALVVNGLRPANERRGANRRNVRHWIVRENKLGSGRIFSFLFTFKAEMDLPSRQRENLF